MPKLKSVLTISLFITLTGFAVFAIEQKMMSIQVKKGAVRSSPSFLGKIVAQLKYGDRVAVKEAYALFRIWMFSRASNSALMAVALPAAVPSASVM